MRRNPLARLVVGWNVPSHDAINDCMRSYEPVIEDILVVLRDDAVRLGIVQTAVQVEDPTSIATRYKSDKDAKLSLKRKVGKKKEWYFGYGLNARIDPFSHLPLSVLFTQSKKTELKEIRELHEKSIPCEIYLADSEFDIVEWIEQLICENTLPVVPYNRRRYGKKGIKYRVQLYTEGISVKWLKWVSRLRTEIEHNWSTEKERFGLEDIHVRGWDKVKTHVYLCLISRYADALAVHRFYPKANVRQSLMVL